MDAMEMVGSVDARSAAGEVRVGCVEALGVAAAGEAPRPGSGSTAALVASVRALQEASGVEIFGVSAGAGAEISGGGGTGGASGSAGESSLG